MLLSYSYADEADHFSEDEEKLAELIKTMKAEIAEMKKAAKNA